MTKITVICTLIFIVTALALHNEGLYTAGLTVALVALAILLVWLKDAFDEWRRMRLR